MVRRTESTAQDWQDWTFPSGEKWTSWEPLNDRTLQSLPDGPGAYVLGLPEGLPLGRLLASDPHRLLDVGEAQNLRKRIESLRRCAKKPGQSGHMAGWRLGGMGLLARLNCEAEALRLSWCPARSKHEAYAHEGSLLNMYFDLFGELPPLNYKFNWSAWMDESSE